MNREFRRRMKCVGLAVVVLLFVIAGSILSTDSVYAATKTYKIASASDFHKISSYKGGTFKLTKDIKLTKKSQYLTISKNAKYTIDLNGHKINANFYDSGEIRDDVPIIVANGTLHIKNSAKKKGYINSTEGAAVCMTGGALYTYKNVNITCNNVGFIKDAFGNVTANQASAVAVLGGTYHAKGGTLYGVINGLNMYGGKLYTYGAGTKTYPTFQGYYGNGLFVLQKSTLSLKGGSFISCTSNLSGYYPLCDYYGSSLKLPEGYKFKDASGNTQSINPFGYAKYVEGSYDSSKQWKWIVITK